MQSSKNEVHNITEQEDISITPGGPRPRQKVHRSHGSHGTSKEAVGRPVLLPSPASKEGADDFVSPPGGRRHRSHVHRVESGRIVQSGGSSSNQLRQGNEPGPPDSANWITSAGWSNTTGKPITDFRTTWTVPPAPTTIASQLIYLFNGIEPADGTTIVQPVLQWGNSGGDDDGQNRTGQFWSVASWIVGGADNSATHTPHVQVNPGDVLTGVIRLVSQSATGFVYSCEFEGVAGTQLTTPEIQELVWCVETLEAYELQGSHTPPYDLDAQSEYPAVSQISFSAISIVTDSPGPTGLWQGTDYVSSYGEHTSVPQNSSTNGQVVMQLGQPLQAVG